MSTADSMSFRVETRGGKLVIDLRTRLPDGTPFRERRNAPSGVTSKSGARRWAAQRLAHLTTVGTAKAATQAPSLKEFSERWMEEYSRANRNKPSTLAAKETILRLHLLPVLGATGVDRIGEPEIQRVKLRLAGKSNKTVVCVLSVLQTMLSTAARWELLARVPAIAMPHSEAPRATFYDFEEWERLIHGASKVGPEVLAAILLAGDAGLRRGEIVALEQSDVERGVVRVSRSEWEGEIGSPKGGKTRLVPLTARLAKAIEAIRHLRGKRLLWQANGTPVGVTTLQSWLETACRRAGLPQSRNLHRLRHTFCSHLAMLGATPKAIQELAGHSDLKTTQRYMHLSPAHIEGAIRLLEKGAGGEQAKSRGIT